MSVAPEHRFPWQRIGVLVLVVAVGFALAGILLTDSVTPNARVSTPPTAATGSDDAAQASTLLIALRGSGRRIDGALLMGVDRGRGVVGELVIPGSLVIPADPPARMADLAGPLDIAPLSAGIEAVLGVRLDAVLVVDRLAWEGLLDGTESTRGAGLVEWGDVIGRLPPSPADIAQVVSSMGSMAQSSVPNADLVRILGDAAAIVRTSPAQFTALPVLSLRPGPDAAAAVDPFVIGPLVARLMPDDHLVESGVAAVERQSS